jgi:hypothetical protein
MSAIGYNPVAGPTLPDVRELLIDSFLLQLPGPCITQIGNEFHQAYSLVLAHDQHSFETSIYIPRIGGASPGVFRLKMPPETPLAFRLAESRAIFVAADWRTPSARGCGNQRQRLCFMCRARKRRLRDRGV